MPHLSPLLKLVFLSFSLSTYKSGLATELPRQRGSLGMAMVAAQNRILCLLGPSEFLGFPHPEG